MTPKEQEIYEAITVLVHEYVGNRDLSITTSTTREISPEKLATFLATLVPEKECGCGPKQMPEMTGEEIANSPSLTVTQVMCKEHFEERYPGMNYPTPPSEEKKCCTDGCAIWDSYAKRNYCADRSCPCHSPTPPDAWDDFIPSLMEAAQNRNHHAVYGILSTKKKGWEEQAMLRATAYQKRTYGEARTTTLEEVESLLDIINQDDHGHYENIVRRKIKYDLLTRLKEMRTK